MPCLQIDKNVERELINHRSLLHPNIIRFKEVRLTSCTGGCLMTAPQHAVAAAGHLPAASTLQQQTAMCLHGWDVLLIHMGACTLAACRPGGARRSKRLLGRSHLPMQALQQ